jgi:hypothetical protein
MSYLTPSGRALSRTLSVIALLGTLGCGTDDADFMDMPNGGGGGGSSNAGANAGAGAGAGAGGKATASGGSNTGKAGSTSKAGSSSTGSGGVANGDWVETSPPESSDCSGVAVNRLTGDVFVALTNKGIWQSSNQGGDWKRVDGGAVGGLIVLGPGFDVDQDNPKRMAAWSLDGDGGWTNDGTTWKKMASLGRNWDFGATDWASPEPKTMIVTKHEADGEVYLSTDGAMSWNLMSIKVYASMGTVPPPEFAMVGVMDATTLIYSEGSGGGILRSTDSGKSFTKVSDLNPRTRVPVLFKGVFYLGGDGLMVSKDKGATWEPQGSAITIFEGPYFGEDEAHIMMTNTEGVFLTSDAGDTWTKVAAIPPDFKYNPQVWGGFAWDPLNGLLYAAAVGVPLLKLTIK